MTGTKLTNRRAGGEINSVIPGEKLADRGNRLMGDRDKFDRELRWVHTATGLELRQSAKGHEFDTKSEDERRRNEEIAKGREPLSRETIAALASPSAGPQSQSLFRMGRSQGWIVWDGEAWVDSEMYDIR